MMPAFLEVLFCDLNADWLAMSREDYLSAVAILHAPDPLAVARHGPETLTLDALHRVAWSLNLDVHVFIRPRSA